MKQLKLNVNGETRFFNDDGTVTTLVAGQPKVKGKWRALSQDGEPQENSIRYQFDGADQPPVPVKYDFNKFNQLVAVIPASANGGADSEPCSWRGRIKIDDAHDLVYELLADDGNPTGHSITVNGELGFTAETGDLAISLTGGGQATIRGVRNAEGLATLTASSNLVSGFDAKDMLHFSAITFNEVPGSTIRRRDPANILFMGNWDIDPAKNKLVFVSKVVGDLSKPDVTIGFAGQFKAITTGFAYFAGPGGNQLAFTIAGQHHWNSNEARFELRMGFSEKKFLAKASGSLKIDKGEGKTFLLNGNLSIEHAQGQKTSLNLSIDGSYNFDKDKRLVFKANVSTVNDELNFDLMLEGKFQYSKGVGLSFQVRVGKTSFTKVSLALALSVNKEDLRLMLSLVLEIEPDKVKLSFEFELQMQFKGGIWIKGDPKKLPG